MKLPENLQNHTFFFLGKRPLYYIEGTTKRALLFFAENDRGLDPHDLPICAPEHCIQCLLLR